MSKNPNADSAFKGRDIAAHPPVPKELLKAIPEGIVLGSDPYTNNYVCKPLDGSHTLLIGGSGSGKSSGPIIDTILSNPDTAMIALDIKGELSIKGKFLDDTNLHIVNPDDRNACGWDVFYSLNKDSSTQDIYTVIKSIVYALIPVQPHQKEPFWTNAPRALLIGFIQYYYCSGITSFVSIIEKILSKPARDLIQEIVDNSSPYSIEYRQVINFLNTEDSTLGGVVSVMNLAIQLFVNDSNVRYLFETNSNKTNPLALENNESIFISIREDKLEGYYILLLLIFSQTFEELSRRSEDSKPILFIIDELPRILSAGKLDLLNPCRVLRSRNVNILLCTQSLEALQTTYTEAEVTDLTTNCQYIIVLSATSEKTQRQVCAWAGKFYEYRKNWNKGTSKDSSTISYEEKDILLPSDLMELQNSGEAVIITPYGYNKINKAPYFSSRYFNEISKDITKHNNQLLDNKGD